MLTTEAFNALLKTLEEPPPHVTFVLATTEPHKLPNTILSRCQRYDFKLVPASRLAQHLAKVFASEQLSIEPSATSLIVRESGGSVRDALSLADQIISYVGDATITEGHVADVLGVADRSHTRTLVAALAGGDAGTALSAVESAIERGVDEVQPVVRYLRDLAVLQAAPDRIDLVDASGEERAELAAEARQIDRSRVSQMFDRMLRCCDELGKTLQPRLVLDCALIDVATIEPLVPLGDLIERLGELEARVRSGRPAAPAPTRTARATSPRIGAREPQKIEPTPAPKPAPAPAPDLPTSGPVPRVELASGSAPHTIPTTSADVLKEWAHVLDKLAQKNITVAGAFEPARVLAWVADRLDLGFPSQFEANLEMAQSPEKLAALREVIEAEFAGEPRSGSELRITIRLLEHHEVAAMPERSVLEASREKSAAERSKREAEAREHPITKHVLATFGAQIKEIKTDV
jgi:DNA polymerase-3 subunit gamma/tau